MSFSGVPVFAGADRALPKRMLRRTRRWSWMVSGWFAPAELVADGGGTACMSLGCSDDFVAVRLGFPNVSERSWRMTRAIARPSLSFGDYVTPTGDAPWTTFTMANGGADSTDIVAGTDGPAEIEVRGIQDTPLGRAAKVRWTWTDWAPIRSLPPDPATGMRVLMLRGLVPSNQTVTFANGQLRTFTGNRTLNRGFDTLIGGLKFNIDMVTAPDRDPSPPTQAWIDNQLAGGTLFPLVQFLTHKPGVSGIAAGDSHFQGTSTTEQFSGFLHAATGRLTEMYFNSLPFSMTNCAVGGLTSKEFFARLAALVPAIQPSYALLPGWTFNDSNGTVKADQTAMDIFLARLLNAIELCDANGILPIVLTPFPRNAEAMTPLQLAPWRWLRERILALREHYTVVVDATSVVGHRENGHFDGTYLPSLSDDQMHPNDSGHAAIAVALATAVRSHL